MSKIIKQALKITGPPEWNDAYADGESMRLKLDGQTLSRWDEGVSVWLPYGGCLSAYERDAILEKWFREWLEENALDALAAAVVKVGEET